MSKEIVQLDLTGVTKELPFRDYYRGRNGLVAEYIAEYLGLPYIFEEEQTRVKQENIYFVPPVTQARGGLLAKDIESSADFYGLLVDYLPHAGKAILHPSISLRVPSFYSSEFAKSVEGFVLPGVTVFSPHDVVRGLSLLKRQNQLEVRLKLPDKSDGHGQYQIENALHLSRVVGEIDPDYILKNGIVLEADLREARTISVGFAVLGNDTFGFIALQKNDIAPEDGRNRYLGAKVRVVRGGMENLDEVVSNSDENTALYKCNGFFERYRSFNPVASRLSFDFLSGYSERGDILSGVTDITGRLGGTCPALVLAAREFKNDRHLSVIESEVSLNYNPQDGIDSEVGVVRFIDLPSLRLTARINQKR